MMETVRGSQWDESTIMPDERMRDEKRASSMHSWRFGIDDVVMILMNQKLIP